MKTKTLTDPEIAELSLIFKSRDGNAWAPRNPGARFLATKGAGEADPRMAVLGSGDVIRSEFKTAKDDVRVIDDNVAATAALRENAAPPVAANVFSDSVADVIRRTRRT